MRAPTFLILCILAGIIIGYAAYLLLLQPPQVSDVPSDNGSIMGSQEEPVEKSVSIIIIQAPDCSLCLEGALLEQAKILMIQHNSLPVKSERELQLSDPEAAALIARYRITELPVVIIEGDAAGDAGLVSNWTGAIGTLEGGALVSRLRFPPYYDLESGGLVGLPDAILIDPYGCTECNPSVQFISALESAPANIVFSDIRYLEEDEAQDLIEDYGITNLPTILINDSGLVPYPIYADLSALGEVEDGWFILRSVPPPYLDLEANRSVRGMVEAIYLEDGSCPDCLDVSALSSYISVSAGLHISREERVDIASDEGIILAEKYNITMVPSLLYSPDAYHYVGFPEAWISQDNTIEEDGWFVFRGQPALGMPYRNISR
ncbi:MAG: hypothetical protein V1827_03935 [Candidatus Micrarchaeota archaeon]